MCLASAASAHARWRCAWRSLECTRPSPTRYALLACIPFGGLPRCVAPRSGTRARVRWCRRQTRSVPRPTSQSSDHGLGHGLGAAGLVQFERECLAIPLRRPMTAAVNGDLGLHSSSSCNAASAHHFAGHRTATSCPILATWRPGDQDHIRDVYTSCSLSAGCQAVAACHGCPRSHRMPTAAGSSVIRPPIRWRRPVATTGSPPARWTRRSLPT